MLVAVNNGPLKLLLNEMAGSNHWIGIRAVTARGYDAIGARVAVVEGDGRVRWRRVATDGSYASASDPRVLFGLGGSAAPVRVRVVWPGGATEELAVDPVDRWITLKEDATP